MRKSAAFIAVLLLAALAQVSCAAVSSTGGARGGDAGTPQLASAHVSPQLCAAVNGRRDDVDAAGQQAAPALSVPSGIRVPAGFTIEAIAQVSGARELAALPNGDLIVGTHGPDVYIVPHADGSSAVGTPKVFAAIDDNAPAGVAFSSTQCKIYVGSEYHVWSIPYKNGDQTAESVTSIDDVRTGPVAPHSDGDIHTTTSVAFDDVTNVLYISVGSSCNACTEVDPTRASILKAKPDGSELTKRATRIRNAIAVTVNPATGALWAGGAGQDDLPFGHPYEFMDDVSQHAGIANYGWPECEQNHDAYGSGANCADTVAPIVEFPAYATHIGATFYPVNQTGAYAFPNRYRGALFVASHGSWHKKPGGAFAAQPEVAYVAMHGDTPATPVNWSDPSVQLKVFVGGFQSGGTARSARPTGIAVGVRGSLFVADDQNGLVYRIRPVSQPAVSPGR